MTARTKIAAGLTITLGLLTLALTVTPVNPHRAEAAPAAAAEPPMFAAPFLNEPAVIAGARRNA
jgi:hypothetical protein